MGSRRAWCGSRGCRHHHVVGCAGGRWHLGPDDVGTQWWGCRADTDHHGEEARTPRRAEHVHCLHGLGRGPGPGRAHPRTLHRATTRRGPGRRSSRPQPQSSGSPSRSRPGCDESASTWSEDEKGPDPDLSLVQRDAARRWSSMDEEERERHRMRHDATAHLGAARAHPCPAGGHPAEPGAGGPGAYEGARPGRRLPKVPRRGRSASWTSCAPSTRSSRCRCRRGDDHGTAGRQGADGGAARQPARAARTGHQQAGAVPSGSGC